MTETTAVSAIQGPDDFEAGVVGRLLDGLELQLGDDDEIRVRGDSVCGGYHDEPDRTAGVIDQGWLHTGDLGRVTPDGRIQIVDRKGDIISTADGQDVAPQVIEKQLRAHPMIEEALVAGQDRPHLVALLALREDESTTYLQWRGFSDPADPAAVAALDRHLQQGVDAVNRGSSRSERVRRWAIVPDGFPAAMVTPTMGLKRGDALQRFATEIDRLYSS
jgi:long-chain acyl-CoA synthetase